MLSQVICTLTIILGMMIVTSSASASTALDFGVKTIVLGKSGFDNGSPSAVALNTNTGMLYIANRNSDTVTVVNTTSNTVYRTITTGFSPADVAANPITNRVYVSLTNTGEVAVIDGATNEEFARLSVANAGDIAINEQTNKVFILSNNPSSTGYFASITVVNGVTNEIERSFKVADLRTDIDVTDGALDMAVNSATNTIYVVLMFGNVYAIDPDANSVWATIDVGYEKFPHQIAVNEQTNTIYTSNFGNQSISILDGTTNMVVKTIPVGRDPQGIVVDSKTNMVYVITYGGGVAVVNGTTQEFVGKVPVGEYPERAVLDNEKDTLYVTNTGSNSVSIIDTKVANMLTSSPITVETSAPVLRNGIGAVEPRPAAGQMLSITVQLTSRAPATSSAVLVLDIRDAYGISQEIALRDLTLEPDEKTDTLISWTPQVQGEYQLRTFAISNLEPPAVLSEVKATIAVLSQKQN